jgi:hypothetical protein
MGMAERVGKTMLTRTMMHACVAALVAPVAAFAQVLPLINPGFEVVNVTLAPGEMAWPTSALSLTTEPGPAGTTALAVRSRTPQALVGLFTDAPGRFSENARWVWPDRTWTSSFDPATSTPPLPASAFRAYSINGMK